MYIQEIPSSQIMLVEQRSAPVYNPITLQASGTSHRSSLRRMKCELAAAPRIAISEELMDRLIEYKDNPKNWPLLHFAIHMNRPDVAMAALQLYPEQAMQRTPSIKIVYTHVGNDDDWDIIVDHEIGLSALELAVCHEYPQLVEALLQRGSDAKEMRKEYCGVLKDAWDPYGSGIVYETVKFNQSMHERNYDSRSLLYWALKAKNMEIVELLLQSGASLEECLVSERCAIQHTRIEMTALQVAAELDDPAFLNMLRQHEARN